MKLLWLALGALLLAGCAVVPAPYPYAVVPEPHVSVGIGVGAPVYRGGYYGHRRYRPHWHRGHPHHHRGW